MNGVFEVATRIVETFSRLLLGLPLTIGLVVPSVLVGALLAVGLALMTRSPIRPIAWIARSYIFIFRGVPLLVLLFLIYNGTPQFRGPLTDLGVYWLFKSAAFCAFLGLALNTAAYGSEIIRGGLQSVPYGQIEAGRACGMSKWLLMRRIIFPIAIRQALPGYANEVIIMIKAVSLVGTITLMDITYYAREMIAKTPRTIEIFVCAGVIYLLMNYLVAYAFKLAEYKLSPHLRPAPAAKPDLTLPASAA